MYVHSTTYNMYVRTYVHTHTHTNTHTHKHTQTHAHTHKHTRRLTYCTDTITYIPLHQPLMFRVS